MYLNSFTYEYISLHDVVVDVSDMYVIYKTLVIKLSIVDNYVMNLIPPLNKIIQTVQTTLEEKPVEKVHI